MNLREILTEMEDWGHALLAEHDKRICDIHGPTVPSKDMGRSVVAYAGRIRAALDEAAIDASLHGETPWDEAAEVERLRAVALGAES